MKSLTFGLVVVGTLALNADTVVWYHLDEKASGKAHANNSVIVNAASTGSKYNGSATVYNGGSRSGDSWLLPTGVDSLPTGWGFFDPVTQTSYGPGTALRLRSNKNSQSSWVGAIDIPSGTELDTTNDFTVELFFKCINTGADETPSVEQTLVCRRVSDSGSASVELAMAADGRIMCRYAYLDENQAVKTKSEYVAGITYRDDRWHHAALTYVRSTKTIRLYVDRSLQGEYVLPAELCQTTQPIILGSNIGRGWGGGNHHLDEFRFSNAALTPNQFIRAVGGPVLPVLPETVIYQRFGSSDAANTVGGGSGLKDGVFRNEAFGENTYGGPSSIHVNGTAPVTNGDCAAATFMTNALQGAKFMNDRAARFRPSTSSASTYNRSHAWSWTNVPAKLSDGDFTYEILFRMPVGCPTVQQYFVCEKTAWNVEVSEGVFRFGWTVFSLKRVDDGRWHQLAIVHERATKTVKCYLDYKLEKTFSGEGTKGDLSHAGNGNLTFGAYESPHFNETWSMIDLDEIRVTRKALTLGEMLHPGDGVTVCDLDLADAYGWESGKFAFGAPDIGTATHTYSNAVPYATTHAGIEAGDVTNTRSFFFNKAQAAGGIKIPDPEISLPRGSFTAELVFKVDQNAHETFKDDCAYLFCQSGAFYLRYNKGGEMRFCDSDWKNVATVYHQDLDDGNWHHIAYVQDSDNGELRMYFDYREIGRTDHVLSQPTSDAAKTLYVNCGCWGNTTQYSTGPMLVNRLRIVRKALRPTEFVTSHALEGNLLHWAGFERVGTVVPNYGFSVGAEVAQYLPGAGKLTDADGEVVRENRSSASATGFQFSLNALLERPDVSAEFFLRAASAANGTDLVAFRGASAANPIWALRQTANGLKVVVTTAGGGLMEVASAGDLPSTWTHFALVFAPGTSSTTVTVYRDYVAVGSGSFDGTLQVEGLPTSSLSVGAFDGRVDELRVFKGALAVDEMLHATPRGFFSLVR